MPAVVLAAQVSTKLSGSCEASAAAPVMLSVILIFAAMLID
jgi:hypothetical protein